MRLLTCIWFLLMTLPFARADDGWMIQTGDAYQFGTQNRNIQMVAEDLRITLDGGVNVDVRFTFVNHGPATRVTMGFPEKTANYESTGMFDFRTWVDGRRVKATRKSLAADRSNREYSAAWVKDVSFPKNGRREVRVTYGVDVSGNSSFDFGFTYILATAKTWRMPIRDFRVTVDWKHARYMSRPELTLPGALWAWKVSGPCRRTAVVPNFVPRGDLDLAMRQGYWNFTLNGTPLSFPSGPGEAMLGEGSRVLVKQSMLHYFGLDDFKVVAGRLYDAAGKRVRLATGIHRRSLYPGGEKEPCFYLSEVIRALGGSFRYDPREERVDTRLPKNRPNQALWVRKSKPGSCLSFLKTPS